jgi:hypothetical protein
MVVLLGSLFVLESSSFGLLWLFAELVWLDAFLIDTNRLAGRRQS